MADELPHASLLTACSPSCPFYSKQVVNGSNIAKRKIPEAQKRVARSKNARPTSLIAAYDLNVQVYDCRKYTGLWLDLVSSHRAIGVRKDFHSMSES